MKGHAKLVSCSLIRGKNILYDWSNCIVCVHNGKLSQTSISLDDNTFTEKDVTWNLKVVLMFMTCSHCLTVIGNKPMIDFDHTA